MAKEISKNFNKETGYKALISFGSTGKLYTQILYNAPFDVFLAVDQKPPKLLEKSHHAVQRFTYAIISVPPSTLSSELTEY